MTDREVELAKVQAAGRSRLASIIMLGLMLLMVSAGSMFLAFRGLDEPPWVAAVVSTVVGFIAGGIAASQSGEQADS